MLGEKSGGRGSQLLGLLNLLEFLLVRARVALCRQSVADPDIADGILSFAGETRACD